MSKKVFIAVGHGGSDPGAVANGLKEKDLNLAIAKACYDELIRHGVEAKLSRVVDENDPLESRIKECNAFQPDLALDIHNNAGGGDGGEVFYHYKGGMSKTLAQNILDAMVAAGQNSRGIKTKLNEQGKDYFGFIRQTNAPAVIVECAFVDNKKDIAIIDTASEQKVMGVAIAKGVLKTLGIAYIPKTPGKPVTPAKTTIKAGDLVSINKGACYYSGKSIPDWVRRLRWYVHSVNGKRVVIDKSENGRYSIMSPINVSNITKVK